MLEPRLDLPSWIHWPHPPAPKPVPQVELPAK